MADYVAIYSRRDQIASRTNERYTEDNIEVSQRNVDNKINSALRARLGNFDENQYRIILPLSGTTELIDDYSKTYQAPIDDDIKGIADTLVIAMLEHDFSENLDRVEPAELLLEGYITEHFGALSSQVLDFTSDFRRTTKIITTDGKYIKFVGENKVLAAIETKSNTNILNNTI